MTKPAKSRRAFIEKALPDVGTVLEIGAFNNPIFLRELGDDVRYVDWFSRDELINKYKNHKTRKLDYVVDVDFVVKHSALSQAVTQRFDLICASHVIEHIPDVIKWFAELEAMLVDGGHVFLAIPDRNYTFDYFRRASTVIEMIRAHEEGLERPSKWQLADQAYFHQKVNVRRIWAGHPPGPFRPRFSLAHALELATTRSRTYTDTHCWVFSFETFSSLLAELRSAGLFRFEVEAMVAPQPGSNEFHLLLKKPA